MATDDFEDGLSSFFWGTVISGTGPAIEETGGALHMTISDTSTGTEIVIDGGVLQGFTVPGIQ